MNNFFIKIDYEYDWCGEFDSGRASVIIVKADTLDEALKICLEYLKDVIENLDEDLLNMEEIKLRKI